MNLDEARQFLRENHRTVLSTFRADGRPQLSPVAAAVDADGRAVVSSRETAYKVKSLRRDPRASLCVVADNWYGGWEPRFSFAYSVNDKTTIRGAATRSFGPVAGIGQSSHNLGFAVRATVGNTCSGLNPSWIL